MKKSIIILAVLALIITAIAGGLWFWRNSSPEVEKPIIQEPVETVPNNEPEATQSQETEPDATVTQVHEYEVYQEELLDYPSVKWDATGDEWKPAKYTSLSAVSVDLYLKGFKEIILEKAVNQPDLGICEIKDIEYTSDGSRIQLIFTYVTNKGTAKEMAETWEIHAENTGEKLDISGVGNPHPMCVYEPTTLFDGNTIDFGYCSADGIAVYLFYSPATGNMYSLQAVAEHGPSPTLFEYDTRYKPIAFWEPPAEPALYAFNMTMGSTDEVREYEFNIGMTFGQWVNSKFNIDGWKRDPKDSTRIVSADGKYYVGADDIIFPNAVALPY